MKVVIHNIETLSAKRYPLQYITFEKPGLDGEMHLQENEVYLRPDAVAVMLVDEQHQTFLLTRQFRLPTFLNGSATGYLEEICAGLIDEGESPEQAAAREALEETGYHVTELTKIGAVYTSAGGNTEHLHLFTAKYNRLLKAGSGGGAVGEGEDIELFEISFEEAKSKLKNFEFNDAKTIIMLQHYFLQQLI